jgi:hypothetical protein
MSHGRAWLGLDINPRNANCCIGNYNTHVDGCPYYVRPPIGDPKADRFVSASETPIRLLSVSGLPINI